VIARRKREADAEQAAYERALKERAKPPAKHLVETVGPDGRPIRRLVTEDELAAGVPIYEKPEARTAKEPKRVWIVRNGQPAFIPEDQVSAGDAPYHPPGSGGGDKPTQSQSAADAFYSRAHDANNVIAAVENQIGMYDLLAPGFMQTNAGQAYTQAKRQFIEAYLRRDSGAAIGKDEFTNADVAYFPQIGDSEATRQRKAAARRQIEVSIQSQGTGRSTSGNTTNGVVRWTRDANGRPVRVQ
jgi:hypothetical protein